VPILPAARHRLLARRDRAGTDKGGRSPSGMRVRSCDRRSSGRGYVCRCPHPGIPSFQPGAGRHTDGPTTGDTNRLWKKNSRKCAGSWMTTGKSIRRDAVVSGCCLALHLEPLITIKVLRSPGLKPAAATFLNKTVKTLLPMGERSLHSDRPLC